MLLICFDTCLDKMYVTLKKDDTILSSKVVENTDSKYHSAFLISTLQSVMKTNNIKPQDLDLIAVNIGPGSFTGIRACTTVARVMAQQLDIKAIGISSLEILEQINDTQKPTIVALDARKDSAYLLVNKEIKGAVKQTATNQFLNFLSDLKIQEALARNENEIKDADEINLWFTDFENLLKQIYQDDSLKLVFNYRDYSFRINTEGKNFKFTELSDGFAAILDIVADLILKMQVPGNVTRAYKKAGVVLIDEVETHLHLELQKIVMPILTKIFPNIQFIITTHSPFVLNSLDNAVAFDLENREVINELTQYSYEALAEGYFGVSSMSSYMQMQLDKLEDILKKDVLSDLDKSELKYLITDLEKVPESVSPNLVGAFTDIKNRFLIIPSRR